MRAAALLFLILAGLMAFFHFVPVDETSGRERPQAAAVGDYPMTGGFYAVRPAAEIDLARLEQAILASNRARKLAEGIYVTRSFLFGFPDITHVWVEDGNVHIFCYLVYGRSDLGANQRRVEGWLDAL